MSSSDPMPQTALEAQLAEVGNAARETLTAGRRTRIELPGGGRLHIDRVLPFLCVFRRPKVRDEGLEHLITTEAAYLTSPARRATRLGVAHLIETLAEQSIATFGMYLIIEIWRADQSEPTGSDGSVESDSSYRPQFCVYTRESSTAHASIQAFGTALAKVKLSGHRAVVETRATKSSVHPPGLRPLLPRALLERPGVRLVGIEVAPVYEDRSTGSPYPLALRSLRRQFGRALKRGIFAVARHHADRLPPSYQALGRRAMVKVVREIDAKLADLAESFDFLREVTPFNLTRAWKAFQRSGYEQRPEFWYRPVVIDPELTKRQLFSLPVERIEDPTLAELFRAKQHMLDRQISMLQDRGRPTFLYGSLQLFGRPGPELLAEAEALLTKPRRSPRPKREGKRVVHNAASFEALANQELDHYRQLVPDLAARVEIRTDVAGLMSSRGRLLIDRRLRVPSHRADALLHHEIGTHVVTYFNGRDQPLRQLCSGLPRYDELQEGLAVLAEYLVGGLTSSRLRLLALRVIAVQSIVEGASFVETFRVLHDRYDLGREQAFFVTARVHRGGGLTKDMVYLLGLSDLLDHLAKGGTLEPLLVGKFHFDQLQLVTELLSRKLLKPAMLTPRYLAIPEVQERLRGLRQIRHLVGDLELGPSPKRSKR